MYNSIKKVLQKGVLEEHFPGAQYCIVKEDGTIHCDFVGYKQLIPTKELNNGTEIYDVASLTKVLSTTTMIMHLVETKQLNLESKVSDVLTRFRHQDVTIYHLLTHTSGLPADVNYKLSLQSLEDILSQAYNYELRFEVGTQIVYSDIGFILLGEVIKAITNKELNVFANELIFEPLDMIDTSYRPDAARCAPTEVREDTVFNGVVKGLVHDEKSFAMSGLAGHAGLFSTSKDIAKFILSILQKKFILNNDTLDSLFPAREIGLSLKGNRLVRTLGWEKPTGKSTAGDYVSFEDTIIHTGFTGCNMFIDRKNGIGFVMLSNAVHPKRQLNKIIYLRNEISNLIFTEKE